MQLKFLKPHHAPEGCQREVWADRCVSDVGTTCKQLRYKLYTSRLQRRILFFMNSGIII